MKNISKNLNLTAIPIAIGSKGFTQRAQSLISLRALRFVFACLAVISITSCNEKKTEESQEEEKSSTEVALTASQYKTVGIETGIV